jgi:hypothetical protein
MSGSRLAVEQPERGNPVAPPGYGVQIHFGPWISSINPANGPSETDAAETLDR